MTPSNDEFVIEIEAPAIAGAREAFDRALTAVFSNWKARIRGSLDRGRSGEAAEVSVEFQKDYARRGLKDWNNATALNKGLVSSALGNKIAASEWEADDTIEAVREDLNVSRCRFIPMPNVNHGGMKYCFFLPIRSPGDKLSFDLLLFIDGKRWLGFRFEPADSPESTHGYGHVQMNTSMVRKQMSMKDNIPDWLPTSYPAFPIRTSDPMQMFFSMATAVHGYEKGMVQVLKEVFQGRPREVARYVAALKFLES
jgi:hypothetical protein